MDVSKLLTIAEELVCKAQKWSGTRDPTRRVWELMVAAQGFEAWVIGWPPGGAIELHDHGESSGALVVAHGELAEIVVTEDEQGTFATKSKVLPASAVITFDTTHVHELVNLGPDPAISVHVYSPRLKAMTYYEFSNGLLGARTTVRYQLGNAIP